MSTKILTRVHGYIPRACRVAAIGVPAVASSTSALAQSVAGAIDPATGLGNLAPWFLTLVASGMVLIAAYKGTHAFAEGRSVGPTIVGLVSGLIIAFGGYYILSKYGVATNA